MSTTSPSLFSELNNIAKNTPNQIALLDTMDRALTYSDLIKQVEQAHAWLNAIGVKPGDALVALLPNAVETAVLFLASLRGGFIYAPLPCTATLPEITRWKKQTKASVCLLADPVSHTMQTQIKELTWHVEIIKIGESHQWTTSENIIAEKTGALVMQSSGSTGEPKAILLSGDRLWLSAKAFLNFHHLENTNVRFWNYLPMSYLGGLFNLLLIPLAAKGSVLIDDAFSGKTFLGFWATLERYQINTIWLVPSILRGLLTLATRIGKNRVYPTVEYCFLGTAPIASEEKKQFEQIFGVTPLENYGLSETTFISSEHIKNIENQNRSTVGYVMPQVTVQLRATNTTQTVKEIWVKTPYCMLGYLTENGIQSPHFDEQGFMPTGDYGEFVDGQLQIIGRQRDIIKKGGVLILLREIENIASSYPNIIEAAAVRVDHTFYGESFNLYLCIEKSISNVAEFQQAITTWLHKQLSKEKWPENIVLCDDFQRTASGKIQKHLLETKDYACSR